MKIAFVFPGQGSQSVGMLASFAGDPSVARVVQRASDALGQDLGRLIAEGPVEELGLTVNTQPCMLLSKQVGEAVNRAIEKLPEDLRTAIVLRELEGLSYEEIAETMNCPIGTVRSRIFRAREAIAEELRPLLDTSKDRRW